jgi:hypothetical protein
LVSMAAFLLTTSTNPVEIPPDVIKDIINSEPDWFLHVSWLSTLGKKCKHSSTSDNAEENPNRAYKFVMSD